MGLTVETAHRRFTTDEVLRMVDAGIIEPDEPLELLEGELVVVTPQGPPHSSRIMALQDFLADAYRGSGALRVQLPLDASPDGLPEPDLAVVRGSAADYAEHHPVGADVILAVEVARTSQDTDRKKARTYARIGIPVYWLLDLTARRLEVSTQPLSEGRYARTALFGPAETVELPLLGRVVSVAQLLP
ncbi:MAG TPA: Uma2 family endonuclease [Kofleriaceae bacterium]|nr:Uma2 family endonuclease [Kofleriaceae bacterium]